MDLTLGRINYIVQPADAVGGTDASQTAATATTVTNPILKGTTAAPVDTLVTNAQKAEQVAQAAPAPQAPAPATPIATTPVKPQAPKAPAAFGTLTLNGKAPAAPAKAPATQQTTPAAAPATQQAQAPAKQEAPKPAQNKQHEGDTGESLRERLDRFYKGEYSKANEQGKRDLIRKYFTEYFSHIPVSEQRQDLKQINDFVKLVHNTNGKNDCQRLADVIKDLKEKNQVSAMLEVTVNQRNAELRPIGEKSVAEHLHEYKPSAQLPATDVISKSGNAEAQKIAASHVYQLDAKNQVPAVKLYETNVKDQEVLKAVNLSFVSQYKDFAVQNQLEIHKLVINCAIPEVVKAASANINSLDVSVRSQAVQEVRNVYTTLSDTDKVSVDESLNNVDTSSQTTDAAPTPSTSAQSNLSTDEQKVLDKLEGKKEELKVNDYKTLFDLLSTDKLDANKRKEVVKQLINSSYMKSQLSQIATLDFTMQGLLVEVYISNGNVMDLQDKVDMFTNKSAKEKLIEALKKAQAKKS